MTSSGGPLERPLRYEIPHSDVNGTLSATETQSLS